MGNGGSNGKTFTTADIKHVYFGNWLRDYCEFTVVPPHIYDIRMLAQAMDLAGLQKMTKETIIMVLSVLSFLCFGYATE
jgi:Heterokaryon incompatibility protein Het-C